MKLAGLLCAAAVAAAGCSGRSFDRHIAAGDRYTANRQYSEALIEYQNAEQLNPKSPAAHLNAGDAYVALNDLIGAAIEYDLAWTIERNVTAALKAASVRLRLGHLREAADYARAAIDLAPTNVEAHVLLARAEALAGDSATAERQLAKAADLNPRDPQPLLALGDVQATAGRTGAAERSYAESITRAPRAAAARVALGLLYLNEGRTDEGERELRTAVENAPDDVSANKAYGSLLVASERCQDAEPYWKSVAAHATDDSGRLALADYYVYAQRNEDALRVLEPLVRGRDAGGAARLRVASIAFDKGDRRRARTLVDQVLGHDQGNLTALMLKANIALADGRADEALKYATSAAEVAPDAPKVRTLLAAAQAATGER